MSWPKEQFRIVKAYEEDLGHPTLVVVRSEEELAKLAAALRKFGADQESKDDELVEYLEGKGFTVPLSYSTYWPYDKAAEELIG